MKRLTTDSPKTNTEVLLNYAQARDREVVLLYADGRANVNLYEYIAELANKSSLGEISTNTDLPLGAVIGLINDAPTILYRKVVKK